MASGTMVSRQWVLVLNDGRVVVDWGDDIFQDTHSGEFFHGREGEISHRILDDELEVLRRAGRVSEYNQQRVYFLGLPERSQRMLD